MPNVTLLKFTPHLNNLGLSREKHTSTRPRWIERVLGVGGSRVTGLDNLSAESEIVSVVIDLVGFEKQKSGPESAAV